jgi:uroporphyrin-III C-methyltransferase
MIIFGKTLRSLIMRLFGLVWPRNLPTAMVYPGIVGGASLLIALPLTSKTTLVVGDGVLAAARASAALQADSKVIILVTSTLSEISSEEIRVRGERGELKITSGIIDDVLDKHGQDIAVAFITDTLIGAPKRRDLSSAVSLCNTLKKRKILVNVADIPTLCDFTLPACHRFMLTSSPSPPTPSSLQVAVTTNGKGCRLAGRIRREIVSRLPENIGHAVENVSRLRDMVKMLPEITEDHSQVVIASSQLHEDSLPTTPNAPVEQDTVVNSGETPSESKENAQKRRMRWVAQISEYWPLEHLAKLDAAQSEEILRHSYQNQALSQNTEAGPQMDDQTNNLVNLRHDQLAYHNPSLKSIKPPGQIYLLGSGPGHPDLLTVAAYNILTSKATLVLSDKLVPSEVLALIPATTTVKIAKKFPGNNEGAQNELMVEAVGAASRGETVVRVSEQLSN